MNLEVFIKGVSAVGFPVIMVGILLLYIDKKDKINRQDTNNQIGDLKIAIKELKTENKEDKILFGKAVDGFNSALSEFKSINSKMEGLEKDIDKIKDDVLEIKNKV